MADQQSRGGKKQGKNQPGSTAQQQGVRSGTQQKGRSDEDKRQDAINNPDDDPSRAPESGTRD